MDRDRELIEAAGLPDFPARVFEALDASNMYFNNRRMTGTATLRGRECELETRTMLARAELGAWLFDRVMKRASANEGDQ